MKLIAAIIVGIILLMTIMLAGWWGFVLGIFFTTALALLVMSSFGIFVLRGGAGVIITLVAIISFIGFLYSWRQSAKARAEKAAQEERLKQPVVTPTNTPSAALVEALVLKYEGITPCSTDIQYKAKIRTDGDPLLIKFTGVAEWFPHPGKGAVEGPKGVQVGETKFVSADTNRPNVKVWVYEKVTVRK